MTSDEHTETPTDETSGPSAVQCAEGAGADSIAEGAGAGTCTESADGGTTAAPALDHMAELERALQRLEVAGDARRDVSLAHQGEGAAATARWYNEAPSVSVYAPPPATTDQHTPVAAGADAGRFVYTRRHAPDNGIGGMVEACTARLNAVERAARLEMGEECAEAGGAMTGTANASEWVAHYAIDYVREAARTTGGLPPVEREAFHAALQRDAPLRGAIAFESTSPNESVLAAAGAARMNSKALLWELFGSVRGAAQRALVDARDAALTESTTSLVIFDAELAAVAALPARVLANVAPLRTDAEADVTVSPQQTDATPVASASGAAPAASASGAAPVDAAAPAAGGRNCTLHDCMWELVERNAETPANSTTLCHGHTIGHARTLCDRWLCAVRPVSLGDRDVARAYCLSATDIRGVDAPLRTMVLARELGSRGTSPHTVLYTRGRFVCLAGDGSLVVFAVPEPASPYGKDLERTRTHRQKLLRTHGVPKSELARAPLLNVRIPISIQAGTAPAEARVVCIGATRDEGLVYWCTSEPAKRRLHVYMVPTRALTGSEAVNHVRTFAMSLPPTAGVAHFVPDHIGISRGYVCLYTETEFAAVFIGGDEHAVLADATPPPKVTGRAGETIVGVEPMHGTPFLCVAYAGGAVAIFDFATKKLVRVVAFDHKEIRRAHMNFGSAVALTTRGAAVCVAMESGLVVSYRHRLM